MLRMARYVATFADWGEVDAVNCMVDTDTMHVTEFLETLEVRSDRETLCMYEEIFFGDGSCYLAMKEEEWEDAVDAGEENDYGAYDGIVVFNNDALVDALWPDD